MTKKRKTFAEMKKEAILKNQKGDVSVFNTKKTIQKINDESKLKVSAIVSAYNSERFMRGCLEDLIQQTLYKKGEIEIIVIDSGSQENEQNIVNEYQQKYDNLKYIHTPERETVYAAWNRGIKAASGLYITNANTDDRHRKDALEVMASVLDEKIEVGLVYGDYLTTKTENETFEQHTLIARVRSFDYSRELLTIGCFIGPQPMWRKSMHDRYGFFDESLICSGDWEFWLRIAEGTKMLHIPDYLGLYLYSPQSVEHRTIEKRNKENFQIYKKYIPQYLLTIDKIDTGLLSI
jgi:glycosyltransferase involved in cell wall biosynthesis